MNRTRVYSVAILLAAFAIGVNGQEQTKAILVDEFVAIPCGDLLGRTDSFFAELMQYPDNTGLALISENARNVLGFRKWITTNVYMRRFDRSRLKILVVSSVTGGGWTVLAHPARSGSS